MISQEKERVLKLADAFWNEEPEGITNWVCERSAGGPNDFYSEGDYWWPDPDNPGGPYIRKDGFSNPDMFTKHRHAMIRMSEIIGAMASAYLLTGEDKYVKKAMEHLRTWFIDEDTRMNPHMLYAQAIMGRHTGRGIGIIDAIHLVEPALAIKAMESSGAISNEELQAMKDWFGEFLEWISTHEYGIDEMVHPNNHGTCWALQAAAYAYITGNKEMLAFAAERYTDHLLPEQMADDGSFPLELKRTKPYGYSIFNLDAMASLVQVLSLGGVPLFDYETTEKQSLQSGVEFLFPYIQNKSNWSYGEDVLYFDDYPVRQAFLLFGGLAYGRPDMIEVWSELESDPEQAEVVRNTIVKSPLLWLRMKPDQTASSKRVLYHEGEAERLVVPDSLWSNRGTIAFEFKLSQEARSGRQNLIDCPLLNLMIRGNFMWPEFTEVPTPEGARAERVQFAFFNPEQWYHLAVCWDGPGAKVRFYLNGDLQQLANMKRWTGEDFSGPLVVGNKNIDTRNIALYDGFADAGFVKDLVDELDLVPLSGEGREVYESPMDTEKYEKRLVYEADFSADPVIVHEQDLFKGDERKPLPLDADWVIEGNASAETVDGKMVVTNSPEGEDPSDNHAVLWNTEVFPGNFLLEFEMTPKDPGNGLAIIFFCATARETGGSVFEERLEKRDGNFGRYNRGEINCYHTSYWASGGEGSRLTTNLRKNHGFKLVALGDENIAATTMDPDNTDHGPYLVRLMKVDNVITVEARGKQVLKWEDDGETYGPVYGAGQIGLRQMGHAGQITYDSFRVYEILK